MTRNILPATKAVRAGLESDIQFGAVVPPLYLSSNFTFSEFGEPRKYDYTRSGNPTRDTLANALTELENGAGAVITSTGMSAITLCTLLLEPGDVLVAPRDCYGGTYRLFTHLAKKGHFELVLIDLTDEAELCHTLAAKPKMIWIETPANPLLRITDIAHVAEHAKRCGATVVVDNTFLSPALQKPLDLGADIVLHSTTKYLNGHSDVVGGAVIASTSDLHEKLAWWANCLGITGSPFDSYLTLRGVRTLDARIRLHCENARILARFLDKHAAVERVYYPGLESHPGHDIAVRQQRDFGGMISFELAGGQNAVRTFVHALHCFSLAESLGGVESLVAHPATMTHAAMDPAGRKAAGIRDNLIRLSVGIESVHDLLEDLEIALNLAREAGETEFAHEHRPVAAGG